jgi:hypothetical protein
MSALQWVDDKHLEKCIPFVYSEVIVSYTDTDRLQQCLYTRRGHGFHRDAASDQSAYGADVSPAQPQVRLHISEFFLYSLLVCDKW